MLLLYRVLDWAMSMYCVFGGMQCTLVFNTLGDSYSMNAHLYTRQLVWISNGWHRLSSLHCHGNFSIQMYFLKYCWIYLWKIGCQLFYSVYFAHIRMKCSDEHFGLRWRLRLNRNTKLILVCAFGPNTGDYIKMIFNEKAHIHIVRVDAIAVEICRLKLRRSSIPGVFAVNEDKPKSWYRRKLIRIHTHARTYSQVSLIKISPFQVYVCVYRVFGVCILLGTCRAFDLSSCFNRKNTHSRRVTSFRWNFSFSITTNIIGIAH